MLSIEWFSITGSTRAPEVLGVISICELPVVWQRQHLGALSVTRRVVFAVETSRMVFTIAHRWAKVVQRS